MGNRAQVVDHAWGELCIPRTTLAVAAAVTFTVPSARGKAGPLPLLSIHFFKSVLRYSKTWEEGKSG